MFVAVLFLFLAERLVDNWAFGFITILSADVLLTVRLFAAVEPDAYTETNLVFMGLQLLVAATFLYKSSKSNRLMFLRNYMNRQTIDAFNQFMRSFPEGLLVMEG